MTPDTPSDLGRTAVLSLDLQAGLVGLYVKDAAFLPRVARVMQRAREANVPVIHVKVGFRPGVPEANPRNTFLSAVKASPPHQRFFQNESGAIHAAVAPVDADLVVTKSRISAFAGTDLDLLLRANDIETLVVFGIATGGAVLSTALAAADKNFRIVVVSDCCADPDAGLHGCLIETLLPRYAIVSSAEEVWRRW